MPCLLHFDGDSYPVGTTRALGGTKTVTCPVAGTFGAVTVDGVRNVPGGTSYTVQVLKNGSAGPAAVNLTDASPATQQEHLRTALDGSAVAAGDLIAITITGSGGLITPLFGVYIA